LLAGVEGTSLIRVRGSFSGDLRRRVRPSHALRQADDEHDLRRAHGLAADVAATEPEPTPRAPADIVSYRD
jgi:hypothetical protein